MAAALKAVKGGETILCAAQTYGVPRSTLQDRVLGKVTHGVNQGSSMFIVDVAKAGKLEKRPKPLQRILPRRKGLF